MTALPADTMLRAASGSGSHPASLPPNPAPGPMTPASHSGARGDPGVVDLRFRSLVGEDGWMRLPAAVQRRFSKRLAPGAVLLYAGEVLETRLSPAGRVLAFLARVIGAPLPLDRGMSGGATV